MPNSFDQLPKGTFTALAHVSPLEQFIPQEPTIPGNPVFPVTPASPVIDLLFGHVDSTIDILGAPGHHDPIIG